MGASACRRSAPRLNHRHADFQSRDGSLEALYFKALPGRPLPNLHYNAVPCTAHSRKIHAPDPPRMNDAGLYSLLADTILVIHFAFVVFVLFGFMLILVGLLARWSWIHNRRFRIAHLAAIGIVVLQAWFGQLCPLTVWENSLRRQAGESGYTETFVEHWLHEVLFYQAEPWIFTTIYTCFGVLVVLVWFLGRRNRREE